MKQEIYSKEDLQDILIDLKLTAAEFYDNALDNQSFERDYSYLIKPLEALIDNLPDDYTLKLIKLNKD